MNMALLGGAMGFTIGNIIYTATHPEADHQAIFYIVILVFLILLAVFP